MNEDAGVARTFKFLRNGETEPLDMDWNMGIETARQAISEAMNAKNVGFLLGAGCSSLMKEGKEVGIPTMAPLAKEFCGETLAGVAAGFDAAEPASHEDLSSEDAEDNSELATFKKHLDALRDVRIAVVDKIETQLMNGENAVSPRMPVQALWLEDSETLLLRRDSKADISCLSSALADLLGRDDLEIPIKLVLGYSGYAPKDEDIARALDQLKLTFEQYREVREHLRGDLGYIVELFIPLLTIVSPETDIGSLIEHDTEEALVEFLDKCELIGVEGKALVRMAREASTMFDFGRAMFNLFGSKVQLSKWNAVLLLRQQLPLTNTSAKMSFMNHLSAAAQALRSLIAALSARRPEIGTFRLLREQIDGITCPANFETELWDVTFGDAISLLKPYLLQWQASPSEYAAVHEATSAYDLRDRLAAAGIKADLDPIQVARDNREALHLALVLFGQIGLAWALKNGLPNPEIWESRANFYLEGFASHIEAAAFSQIWDHDYILALIKSLPAEGSSDGLWRDLANASSLEELVSRLGLSKEELLAASTKLEARREEARRRNRAINVCGGEFDRSDENLSGLWSHICCRLPTEALEQFDRVNLNQISSLEKMSAAAKRTRADNQTKDKKRAYMSRATENLIGLAGEIHAFRMLQNAYGASVISPSSWHSESSLAVFPDNKTNDSIGCDFKVLLNDRTYFIEVKASEQEDNSFKLGSSEIRLALDLGTRSRRRAKERFVILRVSNALSIKPSFETLPNPYDEKYRSFFKIEEADARVSYRPKNEISLMKVGL